MVPVAVKANTTCRHNATGTVGRPPLGTGALISVGHEVGGSPARDRMGFIADARHEAGPHLRVDFHDAGVIVAALLIWRHGCKRVPTFEARTTPQSQHRKRRGCEYWHGRSSTRRILKRVIRIVSRRRQAFPLSFDHPTTFVAGRLVRRPERKRKSAYRPLQAIWLQSCYRWTTVGWLSEPRIAHGVE